SSGLSDSYSCTFARICARSSGVRLVRAWIRSAGFIASKSRKKPMGDWTNGNGGPGGVGVGGLVTTGRGSVELDRVNAGGLMAAWASSENDSRWLAPSTTATRRILRTGRFIV